MKDWELPFRYLVAVVLMALLAAFFWSMRDAFTPLLVSALAAYMLSPLTNFLVTRVRLKRKLAANLVYFSALAFFVVMLVVVAPAIFREAQNLLGDLNQALDDLQVLVREPYTFGGTKIYLGAPARPA